MPTALEQLKRTARQMGLAKDEPTPDADKQSDSELAKIAEQYGISKKIARHLQLGKQKFGGTSVN
jgi:hypothetical protein